MEPTELKDRAESLINRGFSPVSVSHILRIDSELIRSWISKAANRESNADDVGAFYKEDQTNPVKD